VSAQALYGLPVPAGQSWEELLTEAIRPEFAVAVYLADPDDAVLGRPLCQVPACGAILWAASRLCRLHLNEWRDAGEPSLEQFCGTGASDLQVRPDKCRIASCERSRQARRLCSWHLWRWRKAGKPDQDAWALGEHAALTGNGLCRVPDCGFPATGGHRRFCDWHATRFTNSPFDDPDVFALTENAPCRRVGYDMRALSGVARLEVQFMLQQRHDEQGASLSKKTFDRMVKGLADVGGSLREGTEADWNERLGDAISLLRFARDRLDLLADGAVMDWDDDTWDLRRALGARWDVYKGRRLRFGAIPQPWMRDLAKRWARLRLSSRAQQVVVSNVRNLQIFGQFLASRGFAPTRDGLRREHLEQFLAWLPSTGYTQNTLAGIVATVRTFLDDCAAYGWTEGVPPNARLFPGEGPRFHTGLPRFISEDVMSQLEDPANVAKWEDAFARNLFLVMRETGKRVGEVVTLGRDPVLVDSTGAPCLLYRDHKGKRDAIVPISEVAAAAISDQQRLVARESPASPWLFPRPGSNADGSRHFTSDLFNKRLNRWLLRCDVRDAAGNPVTVSSHQFRHTLATRMLNRGVPQHIVQQMLGHVGADTVATYARLTDKTLRQEFERYQHERVNVQGELVIFSDGSPTAEAEWVKHRISKALQTLPNGECGRPIQQSCPHPNACLTCDDFLTDVRHLDGHRDQLERTRKLVATANADGNFRMAEMNRQVETNLSRVIEAIERRMEPEA